MSENGTPISEDQTMTVEEAGFYLQVDQRVIRERIRAGTLPSSGKPQRIDRRHVDKMARERMVAGFLTNLGLTGKYETIEVSRKPTDADWQRILRGRESRSRE